MTLLLILSRSGHIDSIEDCLTPGLATQKAKAFTESGITCRVVPDELREDVEYLFHQIKEKREDGFIREYGIVPNGTRSKGEGARGIGHMIYPAFGGALEGVETETGAVTVNASGNNSPSLTPEDDLIVRRGYGSGS